MATFTKKKGDDKEETIAKGLSPVFGISVQSRSQMAELDAAQVEAAKRRRRREMRERREKQKKGE